MLCIKCGKEINDGAKFCEHCGATQESVCVSCGKPINPGARFCEHCGATQPAAGEETSKEVVAEKTVEDVGKSKYSRQEQANIVGLAASLETSIAVEKDELKRLASTSFKEQPKEVAAIEAWCNEQAAWMQTKQAKIAFVQNDLKENMEALDVLYTTTKLIPSTYRSIDKLLWLHEDMSSSEHDIERAIDLYNHKETSDLLRSMNENVDEVKAALAVGFTAVYSAIQENNAIQAEILSNQQDSIINQQEIIRNQNAMLSQQSDMVSKLEKVRKSAKTGNFLSVGNLIQNHKRNKMISQL